MDISSYSCNVVEKTFGVVMPYNKSVYFSFGKTALRYLSTNLPFFGVLLGMFYFYGQNI